MQNKLYSVSEELQPFLKSASEFTKSKPVQTLDSEVMTPPEMPTHISQLNQLKGNVVYQEKTQEKVYFSQGGKTKPSLCLEDTGLSPHPSLFFKKNFEENYYNQLSSLIFNNESEPSKALMTNLITVYDLASKSKTPINLTSRKFVRMLPTVCKLWNNFFSEHKPILDSINAMVHNYSLKETEGKTV